MPNIHSAALFVYSEQGEIYLDLVQHNPFETAISAIPLREFFENAEKLLQQDAHIVISAGLIESKRVIQATIGKEVSFGFLPPPGERKVSSSYNIPADRNEALRLALKKNTTPIDLVFCNDRLMLFQGIIGNLPLFGSAPDGGKFSMFWDGLKKMTGLHLTPLTIEKKGTKSASLSTAVSGCLILSSQERGLNTSIIDHDSAYDDGMVSVLAVSPLSISDYLKLMWCRLVFQARPGQLPPSVGYVKSPEIVLKGESSLPVSIDGEKFIEKDYHLKVIPQALQVNIGEKKSSKAKTATNKEKFAINSLPVGREVQKAIDKRVPIFAYASEERFRDLFVALRNDARIDITYVVLMILSTVLATLGLYLNSASVIIGAMLLAPLMAPIISMAMSLLRYDRLLFQQSFEKIVLGVVIAITASSLMTVLSPYQPLTSEMSGRLNPTVLDLLVAIAAGIAGAYSKSYKEVLGNLAGVAIAVALVPPLSVAGIGLGRLDFQFFGNAFLLFITNLIGIVLAATFTFRVLGFSPLVRDKKTLALFLVLSFIILIPLSMAYNEIVHRTEFERKWERERFLVNGKYLIINEAVYHNFRNKDLLFINIHARDQINRNDFKELKRKIAQNFPEEITIRANVTYIP